MNLVITKYSSIASNSTFSLFHFMIELIRQIIRYQKTAKNAREQLRYLFSIGYYLRQDCGGTRGGTILFSSVVTGIGIPRKINKHILRE